MKLEDFKAHVQGLLESFGGEDGEYYDLADDFGAFVINNPTRDPS